MTISDWRRRPLNFHPGYALNHQPPTLLHFRRLLRVLLDSPTTALESPNPRPTVKPPTWLPQKISHGPSTRQCLYDQRPVCPKSCARRPSHDRSSADSLLLPFSRPTCIRGRPCRCSRTGSSASREPTRKLQNGFRYGLFRTSVWDQRTREADVVIGAQESRGAICRSAAKAAPAQGPQCRN